MTQRQICVSLFNAETKQQFLQHPNTMGHHQAIGKHIGKGDIVVCYDISMKQIFGIGILRAIDGDKIYRETHPFDADLYDTQYKQYNKYEIGLLFYPIEPVSIETVNEECGLDRSIYPHLGSFKRVNKIAPWVNKVLLDILIENI